VANLLPNWKEVLRHAWSIRLIILAGALSGMEALQPFLSDHIPPLPYALSAFVVTIAALVARVMAQKSLDALPPPAPEDMEFEP